MYNMSVVRERPIIICFLLILFFTVNSKEEAVVNSFWHGMARAISSFYKFRTIEAAKEEKEDSLDLAFGLVYFP